MRNKGAAPRRVPLLCSCAGSTSQLTGSASGAPCRRWRWRVGRRDGRHSCARGGRLRRCRRGERGFGGWRIRRRRRRQSMRCRLGRRGRVGGRGRHGRRVGRLAQDQREKRYEPILHQSCSGQREGQEQRQRRHQQPSFSFHPHPSFCGRDSSGRGTLMPAQRPTGAGGFAAYAGGLAACRRFSSSTSMRRSTLPTIVLGNSVRNSTYSGTL